MNDQNLWDESQKENGIAHELFSIQCLASVLKLAIQGLLEGPSDSKAIYSIHGSSEYLEKKLEDLGEKMEVFLKKYPTIPSPAKK